MKDLGLLILRLVTGGLMAGHGAQKLFGAFSGPGMEGTAGWLESMGLRPGRFWAMMAGGGEFKGGLLTVLGLASPLGSILIASSMVTAAIKAHWGKPIWVTAGGAELPVTNIAIATALACTGPGKYSLDRMLGIRIPGWLTGLVTVGALGTVIYGALADSDTEEDASDAAQESAAA